MKESLVLEPQGNTDVEIETLNKESTHRMAKQSVAFCICNLVPVTQTKYHVATSPCSKPEREFTNGPLDNLETSSSTNPQWIAELSLIDVKINTPLVVPRQLFRVEGVCSRAGSS